MINPMLICFENFSNLISNGDFVSPVCNTFSAIFPNSVSFPTLITSRSPLPFVTIVPAYAIFILSASSVFSGNMFVFLFFGLVSPR